MYRAIVFDFDGTLAELTIDFALMKRKVVALACALTDAEEPPDAGESIADLPVLELVEALGRALDARSPALGLEYRSRARLAIVAQEMDAARCGVLLPVVRPMLADLRARGVGTGVITRNCSAAVRAVFPDIAAHTDVFLAREAVPDPKPHPDHLHRALGLLGAVPDRVLLVGDHPMDAACARSAGAHAAGVLTGSGTAEALAEAGCDPVAEDCGVLLAVLDAAGLLPRA